MPLIVTQTAFVLVYGIVLWRGILWWQAKNPPIWPTNPTLRMAWRLWLLFLFALAPLSYLKVDMDVWLTATAHLLREETFSFGYVYLPIYAQFLAALAYPVWALLPRNPLFTVYIINGVVVAAYAAIPALMVRLQPNKSQLAPLAVVFAPVTILNLFWGTNHIVMWFCLLLALLAWRKAQWWLVGVWLCLASYKFLVAPTAVVALVLIWWQHGRKPALQLIVGGLVAFLPNLLYFAFDLEYLRLITDNQTAISGHSHEIEMFHFLFAPSLMISGLTDFYIGQKVWIWVVLAGVPLSLVGYKFGRFNTLQALAFSYAVVAIASPEPFRIELLLGLLWTDAIYRNNLPLQRCTVIIVLVHALAWYERANSSWLQWDPSFPNALWIPRGFYVGMAIIVTFGVIVWQKEQADLMVSAETPRPNSP